MALQLMSQVDSFKVCFSCEAQLLLNWYDVSFWIKLKVSQDITLSGQAQRKVQATDENGNTFRSIDRIRGWSKNAALLSVWRNGTPKYY